MRFLQRTAVFAIIFTLFSLQINAIHKYISHTERICRVLAQTLTTQESNTKDAQFFKKCIVNYFGFIISGKRISVPSIRSRNFFDSNKRQYMGLLAKRVERFFIRNGNWYNILKKKNFFKPNSGNCRDLLYVVAAKYVYALYLLNTLRNHLSCKQCMERRRSYALRDREGVCFIKPRSLSCAEEIEINLLGHKSGSLTALFNQFYKEPIGENRKVPGFKENSDILMGVRVSAFSLEKALPKVFTGYDYWHIAKLQLIVKHMKASTNIRLLSLAVAIFRMKGYSRKYFNELLSDQSPLRAKTSLARAFQRWSVELTSFESKIKSFMKSPHYNYELNYRRRHNIAFELVTGRLESSDIPSSWVSFLAEHAMCLIYNVPVYLTPGAVRHSVIGQKYVSPKNTQLLTIELEDYWQSMLENWAEAVRIFKKECLGNSYKIGACLLRMSKSLYLMFDAMVKMRPLLHKTSRSKANEHPKELKDILAITKVWVLYYRNKGHNTLPILTSASFSARKRPSTMMSKQPSDSQPSEDDDSLNETDDFPKWIEPKRTRENGNEATVANPSAADDEGAKELQVTDQLSRDTGDEYKAEPLTNEIEDSHKDVKMSDDTKSGKKDNNAHQTKPLSKHSEDSNNEKMLEKDNESADNLIKTKPQGKNVHESVGSRVETRGEGNDGTSSGIYQTSPLTPEFFDIAETEESENYRKFVTSQVMKPLYVDVEAPAEASVKRTLPPEDMEEPLNEEEETTGSPMVETDSNQNMKDGTTSMVEPLDKNSNANAGSSMTNAVDMNDNAQTSSSMDEGNGSKMKESIDKPVDASTTKLDKQDIEEPTKTAGSPVEKPLNKDSEESVGSPMGKQPVNNHKESLSSQMMKPVEKDTKETDDSSKRKTDNDMKENAAGAKVETPLEKDSKETTGSPTKKPLNNDMKESAGAKTGKPLEKNTEEATDSPKAKPLDNHVKETAGSPKAKPLYNHMKETADSPKAKPLDNHMKETAGSPKAKPLDNHMKETAGSPAKPLDKDVKETAGVSMEEHDDFPVRSTSDVPIIPQKTPLRKSSGNKTKAHPRYLFRYGYYSYYRRRRYSSVWRRRRNVYVGRRRRYSTFSRRRRSQYMRRRRISNKVIPKPKSGSRDETQNIQKFLWTFGCHVGKSMLMKRVLTEGCMDKIQLRIRKYNRVAFAHFTQVHVSARPFGWRKLMKKLPKDDVLVKTEL